MHVEFLVVMSVVAVLLAVPMFVLAEREGSRRRRRDVKS